MTDFLKAIQDERERQNKLGYTPENDLRYTTHQLARASAAYTLAAYDRMQSHILGRKEGDGYGLPGRPSPIWPWGTELFKPHPDNRLRELVKAGALLYAEYERISGCLRAIMHPNSPEEAQKDAHVPEVGDNIKIIEGGNVAPKTPFYGIVRQVERSLELGLVVAVHVTSDLVCTIPECRGVNFKGSIVKCYAVPWADIELKYESDTRGDQEKD